jgi:hypothetical protein
MGGGHNGLAYALFLHEMFQFEPDAAQPQRLRRKVEGLVAELRTEGVFRRAHARARSSLAQRWASRPTHRLEHLKR